MGVYVRLLRQNPEFAKLWLAQVISLTGDWFNTVVLSALVAEYSGGSGFAVSLFLMARFLPPLLVSPFAGVLVDRFNRKQLLIWSNLLRALVVPLFLLATTPDMLWLIYVVTLVQFTLSAIFEPGQSAIIPSLTRPDMLVEANTLISVTWSVMLALGAVLGGLFAFVFGTAMALVADALTFALAAAFIAWIDYDPVRGRKLAKEALMSADDVVSQDSPEDTRFSEDTRFIEALRYVWRTPPIAGALLIKLMSHIGNVDTLLTIFATQIFVIGAKGEVSLGILYSVFGIGAFLGPIFTNWFNDGSVQRMRRLVIVGFIALTLGWVLLGFSVTLVIASIALFMRAVGGSINWTYSTVIIQKTAPDAKLGRVFALDFAGFQFVTVISTLAHGALIDIAGIENIYWIAAGTGFLCFVTLLLWIAIVIWLERYETERGISSNAGLVAGD